VDERLWDAPSVRLTSSDGASVELRPTRYELPAEPIEPGDWDANWLEVHGQVRTAEGESWPFEDPCLTTWEARQLRDWLRAAAEGRVPVTAVPSEESSGVLGFTESNLGFSVAALEADALVLRVHFSHESLAGRPGVDQKTLFDAYANSVALKVGREDLLAAGDEWQKELGAFPER
jgi:hypothetical protein